MKRQYSKKADRQGIPSQIRGWGRQFPGFIYRYEVVSGLQALTMGSLGTLANKKLVTWAGQSVGSCLGKTGIMARITKISANRFLGDILIISVVHRLIIF
jgi:hypothetical protein